jgi:hypothetical protein
VYVVSKGESPLPCDSSTEMPKGAIMSRFILFPLFLVLASSSASSDIDSVLLARNSTANFIKQTGVLDTMLFAFCDSLDQRVYKAPSLSAVSAFLLSELKYKVLVLGLVTTTNPTAGDFKEKIKSLDTYWFWDVLNAASMKGNLSTAERANVYCCFNILRTLKYDPKQELVTRKPRFDLNSGLNCSSGNSEYVSKIILSSPAIYHAYVLTSKTTSPAEVISDLENLMDKYKLDLSYQTPKLVLITKVSDF